MKGIKQISTITNSNGIKIKVIGKEEGDIFLENIETKELFKINEHKFMDYIHKDKYEIKPLYDFVNQEIPQGQREDVNKKILDSLNKGIQLDPKIIYNLYTGIGGLHQLNFNDFDSFHDYTQAKQEFESGQFFTHPEFAKTLVSLLRPVSGNKIIELGCGAGAFCNFLPRECEYYGFDIDNKALNVGKTLYPNFIFKEMDMREITPNKFGYFDIAIGNPPFNIRLSDNVSHKELLSQDIFLHRIEKMLVPYGKAGFIIPAKRLQDEMVHKSIINFILERFYILGQYSLPKNAFKFVGVENFETKIIILQKKGEFELNYINQPKNVTEFTKLELVPVVNVYNSANLGLMNLFDKEISIFRKRDLVRGNNSVLRENLNIVDKFKNSNMKILNKLLNLSQEQQAEIKNLWFDLQNQTRPINMDAKEWEKNRLTEGKIIGKIKQYHYRNTHEYKKEIELIHRLGKFEVIGKDYFTNRIAKKINEDFNLLDANVILNPSLLEDVKSRIYSGLGEKSSEYRVVLGNYKKILKNKTRVKNIVREEITEEQKNINTKLVDSLDLGKFTFGIDPISGTDYSYHRDELINTVHKPYKILNWEPGSGKTIYAINWLKIKGGRTLVISNALAIKTTWKTKLPEGNLEYIMLTPSFVRTGGLEATKDKKGVVYLLTGESSPDIYKFIRKNYFRNIIIDESEVQIKNTSGIRSKAIMTLRTKARNKLIMSGTLTRNNVAEFYNQLNFVLNNSYLMINEAESMYFLEEKKGKDWKEEIDDESGKKGSFIRIVEELSDRARIVERENPKKGENIGFKGGYREFQRAFSPSKPSVFGISKMSQSLYNLDAFNTLTKGLMSYKKQDRDIRPQQIQIEMTPNEKELYFDVVNEFYKFVNQIYNIQTDDSRKKSLAMISLQINALFKVTSAPYSFPGYGGGTHAKALKIIDIIKERPNDKIIIGTNWVTSNRFYHELLKTTFPNKKIYYIDGESVKLENRQKIADDFCNQEGGAIILATTQSMQNSISIPNTDLIIVESLTRNYAQFKQFYSRGIRANSPKTADVYYLATNRSLEQNLIGLIINKHELTSFINTGEIIDREDIINELGVTSDYMDEIVSVIKEEMNDGRSIRKLDWGKAKISQNA